jgi:DNA-binding LacI/PurR family transcriptional regulator
VEMGREATRMVLDLHLSDTVPAPRVDLATALIVRGSTAPPAPADPVPRRPRPESTRRV